MEERGSAGNPVESSPPCGDPGLHTNRAEQLSEPYSTTKTRARDILSRLLQKVPPSWSRRGGVIAARAGHFISVSAQRIAPVVCRLGARVWEALRQEPRVTGEDGEKLDDLPAIRTSSNWRLPSCRLPRLMLHDMGPSLDDIGEDLLGRLRAPEQPGTVFGRAAEMATEPGTHRTLRVLHRFRPGHSSTTDVVLRREGDDLFLSLSSRPRTLLTQLNLGARFGTLALGVLLLLWVYLAVSGARGAWVKDYVDRHVTLAYNDHMTSFMNDRLSNGGYTIDWAAFTSEVFSDQETIDLLWEDLQSAPGSGNPVEDGAMFFVRDKALSWREHVLQWLASKAWLPDGYGDRYFAWFDSNRPIVRSFGFAGMVHEQPTGQHAWTQLEIPSLEPLRSSIAGYDGELDRRLGAAFDRATSYVAPWSISRLAREDPRTALFNLGMPVTILASLVGFLVWRAPRSWLRFPCRLLRWPTPDDFDAKAVARNAWVERQVSKSLAEFGVGRSQVTELQGDTNSAV